MDLHADFHVYDTTLRDGAQQEGLNLSVADKLSIARHLDGLGVGYIEGGWPGANPKDTEFFRRAAGELDLRHA
ncbi:MAG: citramalate synthase, partial [Nocardioides sp.]